jgi:predicted RNA binding protein YcfA (HicA-like mRNA interferase family)
MSKLPQVSGSDVVRALQKIGFKAILRQTDLGMDDFTKLL